MKRFSLILLVAISLVASSCDTTPPQTDIQKREIKKTETTQQKIPSGAKSAPVSKPKSTLEQAPAPKSNCDPNYSGCVPVASDVDCAGGSGNGPAYVRGPINVIGTDIYGLDRDGDGIACE